MTFEEFRNKWYNNDCYVERSKFTIGEYNKEQEKLFNQALADERAKTIEDVMIAFKYYQNMNNPKNAHIFWEQLEDMKEGA